MVNEAQQPAEPNQAKSPTSEPSLCETAVKTSQVVTLTAAAVGQELGKIATQAGSVAVEATTKQTHQLFELATEEAGKILSLVGDNPILQPILKVFRADWLLTLVGKVDTTKAAAAVQKLQQEHPAETPREIAHRIMVEKSLYAGGVGLASSVLPGVALALLAIDLVATTQLQAEMVYQIAAAYGMDLHAPARRGEVLAIFGLSLGGSRALKAGLGLLRNVPLAGMVLGAGTNAVMLYTVGYAACQFYEAKVSPLASEVAAEEIRQGSEAYLAKALAQQAIVDQILVHQILASYPDKSWADIGPELQSLNFDPATLEGIAANLASPQSLDTLLQQLERDYAAPLLARCYAISLLDDVITGPEEKVMTTIASRFNLDLKTVEAAVKSGLIDSAEPK